ncbi:hypothetical protein ACOSOMT5_P1700 [Acidiphilium sp. MT5]
MAAISLCSGGRLRERKKTPRLARNLPEIGKTTIFADDIEQVAMLAGRSVGPFARGPFARIWAIQPNKQ